MFIKFFNWKISATDENNMFYIFRKMIIEIIDKLFQIISGYILSDIIMGIYHWIKDTYFTPFTPIIGKTFIWGSRLHHVRPRYVMEFSNIDLFYDSAKWTLSWIAPLFYFFGFNAFLVTMFLTISMNDIVHKYTHFLDHERPLLATILQRVGIFQSHEEHHVHHISPHEIKYCPITPYTNGPLEAINFWRRMENIIERLTGVKPRAREIDFTEDENYPAGIKFIE
ncbi:putative transmembrane protein [Cotonvirus japonicus]|uniref:Transmembrane protein n=1 Tax=Cotonvirus japonicus TaxID=2811091 RepID=A0ABM7NTQ9_9VIRU|nr:putative transmembrane protein [Cotonvirus japonicus]BCS83457.1 putative transmembrane protein [Cotonvirus japonicus]